MATQTETYKLNKPARTDKIDIEDLNENFDIIEEELNKRVPSSDVTGVVHYDLDLSAWVSVDMSNSESASFTLTDYVKGNELITAISSGRTPRVQFLCADGTMQSVALCSRSISDTDTGTLTKCNGVALIEDNEDINCCLHVLGSLDDYEIWFTVHGVITEKDVNSMLEGLPITVASDGYTDIEGLRQPTTVSMVKSDSTITVTIMLEGNQCSESVVTLDENGYPTKIVTDGTECTVTWEGFDG